MSDARGFLAVCLTSFALSCASLDELDGESTAEPTKAPASLSEDAAAILGWSLAIAMFALGVGVFRAFTPPPEPFVVEYVSPKIDSEELRNL